MLRFACNEPGLVKWLQKKEYPIRMLINFGGVIQIDNAKSKLRVFE